MPLLTDHYRGIKREALALVDRGTTLAELSVRFGLGPRPTYRMIKKLAKSRYTKALREGVLVRGESCADCGRSDRKIHGHHNSYLKPLEVEWLCEPCHKVRHHGPRRMWLGQTEGDAA